MARPKKAINYEEEFMRIDAQITRHKNTIKELEEERRSLLQQREQSEISKLYELYKSSGMSLDDIVVMVSGKSSNREQVPA